jgi:flagellar protein FliO/FliZ
MNRLAKFVAFYILTLPISVMAAEASTPSATASILKMIVGLAVVLGVMALFAWGAKRFLPNTGHHAGVVKVIGGTSVGTRERVVVLEIADRWIVVGVANGQVSALANLAPGADIATTGETGSPVNSNATPLQPFANWMKQSMNKLTEK